jgi:mannose-6-phosphate isomerase-like protein (cupin superfamily)
MKTNSLLEKVIIQKMPPVHSDNRRAIYDPQKITNDLEGDWYAHNLMEIYGQNIFNADCLLGKHHHDYEEVFFIPSGILDFLLIDPENPKQISKIKLDSGKRLFIPKGVDHLTFNKGNNPAILMGYGNVPFDPKRLIPSNGEVLKILLSEAKQYF